MKGLLCTLMVQTVLWPTAFTLGGSNTATMKPLAAVDEARARLPRPPEGSPVLSSTTGSISFTLNEWTEQKYPATSLRPCASFSIEDLNDILSTLVSMANPFFQEIYKESCKQPGGCDKRSMRYETVDDFENQWQNELAILGAESNGKIRDAVAELLRNGKCYEAAQVFHHHLSEEARAEYTDNLVLPLLPTDRKAFDFLMQLAKSAPLGDTSRRLQYEGHGHILDNETTVADQAAHQEALEARYAGMNATKVQEALEQFITVSPCQIAHRVLSEPWSVETGIEVGLSPERAEELAEAIETDTFNTFGVADPFPDSEIPGSGYVDCGNPKVCLDGGDVKYMMQAAVREYTVKGSGQILTAGEVPIGTDVRFQTRSFEAMPGENQSEWGPPEAGGDGTAGLLGPAIVANPGDKVHIFVKNNLGDTSALQPPVPTFNSSAEDYWARMEIIRKNKINASTMVQGVTYYYRGPQWTQNSYPLNESNNVPADQLVDGAGEANVPGLETNGWDVFNIHMHGWEVAPHLFEAPGTSNPEADWITITPEGPQQCMCYKLEIAKTQSRGDYLYHTHRHGTTTMLSWGGMFGLSLTGEESVTTARTDPSSEPTLTADLVKIADAEGLEFDDSDVNIVVIYDSVWKLGNVTNSSDGTAIPEVVLTDFITGERGIAPLNPFLVNNEYQPTIEARTGALTEFRIACVSAGRICAFLIEDPDSNIVPFDRVASDGISYMKPVHRRGSNATFLPDVDATEAYLSMGGGMREAVVVQFPRNGTYTIWQRGIAFDDMVVQQLMTVVVSGSEVEVKDITSYNLASGRPLIDEDREIEEYRGMTFQTNYNQEVFPFPNYKVGDINGVSGESYNVTTFDIGVKGGTCGIWILRTRDVMLHPFHIHVNPFIVMHSVANFDDNPDIHNIINDYTPPWDTEKGSALKGIWRDTAYVPPYGYLVIKQCYDAGVVPPNGTEVETFAGKFVFHCHFLVHEDTGLMRNVILASNVSNATASPSLAPTPTSASNATPAPSPVPTPTSSSREWKPWFPCMVVITVYVFIF